MFRCRHYVLDTTSSYTIQWTGVNKDWVIGLVIVYIIIFALMIPGFLRFRKLIGATIVVLTILCAVPLLILNWIASSQLPAPDIVRPDFKAFTDYKVNI